MNRILSLIVCVGVWLSLAPAKGQSPAEPPTVQVMATGVGLDADKALRNALRNAVEQTVGMVVDAQTLVKNEQIIKDQVLTYSDGYVEKFEKFREGKRDDGLFEVKITAVVKRRQLIEKLQQSKVIATRVDGQSLFGELATQMAAGKNAAQLLEKALEGLPLNLLFARVAEQKPKIEAMTDASVTGTWTVLVSYDYDAYRTRVLPVLHKTLMDISKKRCTGPLFVKQTDSDFHNRYMVAPLSKSVFWKKAGGYNGYSERPDVEKLSWDPATECLVLVHWIRAPQDGTEQLGWYVLDKACLPVLEAVASRRPRLHISLVDQQGNAVQDDQIEMAECKFQFISRGNSILVTHYDNEFPWFVNIEGDRRSPHAIVIQPMMRAADSMYSGMYLGNPLEFKWTRTLTLEEIKNLREIRCRFTDEVVEPKTGRRSR